MTDIGLDHIDQPVGEQGPEAPAGVVAFANGQRYIHLGAHPR